MEYTVVFSGQLLERIAELLRDSALHGQGEEVSEAARKLQERLSAAPEDEGELIYHVPSGIPVYHAVFRPLHVWFALYEEHHVVWVTRVERMSSSGK